MLKWCHHVMLHLSKFRSFWEPVLNTKMLYLMVCKKKNPLVVWGRDRKICPSGLLFFHHSARLVMPGQIYLSHTHDGFIYSQGSLGMAELVSDANSYPEWANYNNSAQAIFSIHFETFSYISILFSHLLHDNTFWRLWNIMYLKILWKLGHLLFWSKCSNFHNI